MSGTNEVLTMVEDVALKGLMKAREGILKEYNLATDKVHKARIVMEHLITKAKPIRARLSIIENSINTLAPGTIEADNTQDVTTWLQYALMSGGKSLSALQAEVESENLGFSLVSIKAALAGIHFTVMKAKLVNGIRMPAIYVLRDNLYKDTE